MAEEENPWKPLFWQRVAAVNEKVSAIRENLSAVQQQLAPPVTGERFPSMEDKLREPSMALGHAVCYMEAAVLLALFRGGLDEQGSIPVYGLDDDDAVRRALLNLRHAKARGEDASDALDRCRGHLGAFKRLLLHTDVPGVADHVGGEHGSAGDDLEAARQFMVDVDAYITAAVGNGPNAV
uniref:Uncharacterized protein n=1 Tax=Leersia perrieri TaxID=77586 RepID=A0A0D9UWZ1_9ORYZ